MKVEGTGTGAGAGTGSTLIVGGTAGTAGVGGVCAPPRNRAAVRIAAATNRVLMRVMGLSYFLRIEMLPLVASILRIGPPPLMLPCAHVSEGPLLVSDETRISGKSLS